MMNSPNRRGLTLVELMVVIVILALIVGVVGYRWSGSVQTAKLQWGIDRIEAIDGMLRSEAAHKAASGTIQFDVGTGTIERELNNNKDSKRKTTLGHNLAVTRVITQVREASQGETVIDYSPQGTAETYAVELTSANGHSVWIMVAGLTGQLTRLDNERTVTVAMDALKN